MKVRVLVRLKPGVLDVQGKAVERAVHSMGLEFCENFRIGRLVEFELADGDLASRRDGIDRLCQDLLANPIIEDVEVQEAI